MVSSDRIVAVDSRTKWASACAVAFLLLSSPPHAAVYALGTGGLSSDVVTSPDERAPKIDPFGRWLVYLDDAETNGLEKLPIARARVAPAIDGVLESVWADAATIWIGQDIYSVTFRALHDGRTLYLLFEDLTNAWKPGHDEFWIFFDDEGGTPPRRWDGLWGADPCDADYPEEEEEGGWGWINDEGYALDERWRQVSQAGGVCADQSHLGFTRAAVTIAVPEGPARAEVAIPLGQVESTLGIAPGDEIGLRVDLYDGVFHAGVWPLESNFGLAQLAVLGCNVEGGEDFDPGFPLDWEVAGSGAAAWRLSGTGGGECGVANETGGPGDAACAVYDGSLDGAASNLISPWFSLASQTNATLSYRAKYSEQVNAGSALTLEATTDGITWVPLLTWATSHASAGGEAVNVDLSGYSGSPRLRLRWRFSIADGFAGAQVDEVRVDCAPFLFADGFETGLTTHWSAEAP